MPAPPQVSPVTGNPVPPYYLHSSSVHFQDTNGRRVLLRGVNLSGAAKNPASQPSQSQDGFWEDAEAGTGSWINSTLNLDDGSADVHLSRLRAWGYNMLRFCFTWEALEHAGPGKYDYEYMEYVVKCLYKCKEYGFRVFMDPHQDVWSRFSGGSGAPLWTIYACGIDPHAIVPTFSALVHCDYPSKQQPDPESLPGMIWSSNYHRTFGHTIWTLFFAGKEYAPKCIIDGVNIQDYLQSHFTNAVRELARRIAAADGLFDECVLGWDSVNEPAEGMIGIRDLRVVPKEQPVRLGPVPTPFENMRLGMGEAVTVPNYTFGSLGPAKSGSVTLDPQGIKLWLKPEDEATRGGGKWGWTRGKEWKLGTCIWAQHGVWNPASGRLLKPDYFATLPSDISHKVEFVQDFWRTHWLSYASELRTAHPEAIHFMNTTVFKPLPKLPESFLSGRACATPHYYDGLTLMTKHWGWFNADALGILRGKYWSVVQGLRVGEPAIRNCIQEQLGVLKEDTAESIGNYPTLIGEIGCPYDMDGRRAYGFSDGGKGKGDYSAQQKAWDCSVNANDGPNMLNYTLWTYVPENCHRWGDNWNGEDLSLWSADDRKGAELNQPGGASAQASSTGPLGAPSMASSRTLTPPLMAASPKGVASGEEITPRLLLDGSRAVAAICRPFPIATVGTPEYMSFDINSTKFKLSVRVKPDDAVAGGVVTEIYVPFVHYAANLDWDAQGSRSVSSSATSLSSDTSDRSTPTIKGNGNNGPLALNIDVKTSIGSWEVTGQTLRWTYPIPATPRVFSIEICRSGGALRENVVEQPQGLWSDVLKALAQVAA